MEYSGGPVRIPTNRGVDKVIGRYPSGKNGRMVWSEGALERDYIRLLEFDTDVIGYQEQPVLIKYRYWPNGSVRLVEEQQDASQELLPPGSRLTRYHPDFYVERSARRPLLIEVKNERFLEDPAVKRKLTAGALLAKKRGWEFRVVTDELREGCLLHNVRVLQRYRRYSVPFEFELRLGKAIPWLPMSIRDLAETLDGACGKRELFEAYVYSSILAGVLTIDMHGQRVGPHSQVFPPGGADSEFGVATTGRTVLV